MAPINVRGWEFENGKWTKGSYVVMRKGSGLAAWMQAKDKLIPIGTSFAHNVPAFLGKIDGFIHLKEKVYA